EALALEYVRCVEPVLTDEVKARLAPQIEETLQAVEALATPGEELAVGVLTPEEVLTALERIDLEHARYEEWRAWQQKKQVRVERAMKACRYEEGGYTQQFRGSKTWVSTWASMQARDVEEVQRLKQKRGASRLAACSKAAELWRKVAYELELFGEVQWS